MILLNILSGKFRIALAGGNLVGGVAMAFSAFPRVGSDDCCPPVSDIGPV